MKNTAEDWSNSFDILYNNIDSNQSPGLNAYEKSFFLTKGQFEIILSYFNQRKNSTAEGFDGSPERQADFSSIIDTITFVPKSDSTSDNKNYLEGAIYDKRQGVMSASLPKDILIILNEYLVVNDNKHLTIVPIDNQEYDRLKLKPYKRPPSSQAWRVLYNNKAELIPGYRDDIKSYNIRYVKKPDDINLEDTENPVCKLDPILHMDILQRAVELAKAVYTGDLGSQLSLRQLSQTDIGRIQQSDRQ